MANPRRILLTGASGFVAGHLVPRLRQAFPASELILCGAGHEALDISDDAAVQNLVARVQPEACVHLAAISAVPEARKHPDLAWQVNLHGSLSLGRALLAHAPACTLLYVSSAEIYGRSFTAGIALDETAPAAPMNTYAATKAAADLALGAMVGEGLKVIRVRPFNHTGPGQSADFAVPAFARQIARIQAGQQTPVLNVGALDPLRDFLDVRDVCDAYVACLRRAETLPPGSIFNIASGMPRRIGDVLARCLELAGVQATIATGTALLRPSEIPTASGNAARARDALGWKPNLAWDDTLRDVLADWRDRVATGT
ncbi:MAG: GDP-mannose 4,6-dehydratase [Acidiphilium sp.]|nr:GDP-mannose 4,6-dehydratase [Acidiphilium sp.]MDD4936083.1 GDP-mannose 4,6-dehydratase [Acidiphilium sp.]